MRTARRNHTRDGSTSRRAAFSVSARVTAGNLWVALGRRYGDAWDWTEIDAWTQNIAYQLPVAAGAG
jgi:hypothetical protein